MSDFEHWCRFNPVATVSTALFAAVVLVALARGSHRRWFAARLAPQAPSTGAYFGALDSYRGLAALMVAVAHAIFFCYPVFWESKDWAPYLISHGGNKAVPVFVLLSGFLVYRSARRIETTADIRDYVRRRFLRIYPLYFVTAVAVFATGQVTAKPRTVIPELLMFRTLDYPTFGNPPAWSLYAEVVFYVFLPVFVLACGRHAGWAAAGLFVALAATDTPAAREFHVWKFFFLGILTSHLYDLAAARLRRPAAREVVGLAASACGVALLYHDVGGVKADWIARLVGSQPDPAGYTIGLGLGFGLLTVGTLCSRAVSGLVSVWPLRALGTISYSVFLIHPFYLLACFPQLVFSKVGTVQPAFAPLGTAPWWYLYALVLPGLFLWAGTTYLLVERPFLLRRPKPEAVPAPAPTVGAEAAVGESPAPPVVLPFRRAA